MELNDATFRNLLDVTDPIGVLTVTTGFVPGTADDQTSRLELQNQLKATSTELEESAPERARALKGLLDRLGDDLDGMLSPNAHGRGRALVAGLDTDDVRHLNVQVPFEHRVVVADRPFVRPLVAAIDEGRPAGIVVGTRSGARVLEWSIGGTRELATLDFELSDAQLADQMGGPAASNPARGQTAVSHKEAMEDRIEGNRQRFLKDVAGTVASMARERGWDRLVVAGSDRIREELAEMLADPHTEVIPAAENNWENLSTGRIAQEAWPLLRSVHRSREEALVDAATEQAHAGGAAVLGARHVCEAANIGRVSHLLFTQDAEVDGHVASDGSLHADVGGPAAQAGLEMSSEPHLVEQLVERVLRMGGHVTRVDGEDAGNRLAEHDGLAAQLRW